MNLLDREAYVTIDNKHHSYDDVYDYLNGNAITIKSATGLEVATFIIAVTELIALIVSMPVIQEAFNRGHIIVMIGGIKFDETVGKIIKELEKHPDLLEAAKSAYINDTISVEGKAGAILSFKEKLKVLIEEMGKNDE